MCVPSQNFTPHRICFGESFALSERGGCTFKKLSPRTLDAFDVIDTLADQELSAWESKAWGVSRAEFHVYQEISTRPSRARNALNTPGKSPPQKSDYRSSSISDFLREIRSSVISINPTCDLFCITNVRFCSSRFGVSSSSIRSLGG